MAQTNHVRPTLKAFAFGYLAGHYLFRWFTHMTRIW
jgi:hypothetical protein